MLWVKVLLTVISMAISMDINTVMDITTVMAMDIAPMIKTPTKVKNHK